MAGTAGPTWVSQSGPQGRVNLGLGLFDDALDGAFDGFAGQGGLGGAEDELEGDGLFALRERLAAVGGDVFDVLEVGEREGFHEGLEVFVAGLFGDDEGEVAADGGELGEGFEGDDGGDAGEE